MAKETVYASFDDMLSDVQVEFADVTTDGKVYRLGSISGEDFVAWTELRDSGPEGKKNASALLIIRSLVDGVGARIGDESQIERVKKIKLKTSEMLLKAIFKLNGLNQPEAAAKNG